MFYLFNPLILPILTYGSDIWGTNTTITKAIDKVFLRFTRMVLGVKATTNNICVMGESGQFPPSIKCHISILNNFIRLNTSPQKTILGEVFSEIKRLHNLGFPTWVTRVNKLASYYKIDMEQKYSTYEIKSIVQEKHKHQWSVQLNDIQNNPSLRIYKEIKSSYSLEPYIEKCKNARHRIAISKLRMNSHTLEIERGRHCRPKIPVDQRLCSTCLVLEDEKHFLTGCNKYNTTRNKLYERINTIHENFSLMSKDQKFIFMMTSDEPEVISSVGHFIHTSFQQRIFTSNYNA